MIRLFRDPPMLPSSYHNECPIVPIYHYKCIIVPNFFIIFTHNYSTHAPPPSHQAPPPTHTHTHTHTRAHTHTHVHTSSQLEVCSFPYSVYFRFLKFLYTDQVDSENLTLDETISKSANSLQQVATLTLLAVSTDIYYTIVHTVKS